MTPRALLVPIAAFAALLAFSPVASADVPGPKPRCDAEGKGCTECWRHYGSAPEDQKSYEECANAAKARGLVEACHHRQGAGDSVYFCPQGVKVETKMVGGCAGCAMDASAAPDALSAIAAGLGILALRRRRRG